MDNQTPAEQDGKQSEASLPPPNTNTVKPDPIPKRQAEPQPSNTQMSGFEKATLRWAKTAVIMSGLAAVFVCAQWWEMHEGGIDTHNLADASSTQTNLLLKQLKGTQAAVVRPPEFGFGDENVVTVSFANFGHVIASDVHLQVTIARETLPSQQPIGTAQVFDIVIPQLAPAPPAPAWSRQYRIPGFSSIDREALSQMKQTIVVRGKLQYGTGFGDTIELPLCSVYLEYRLKIDGGTTGTQGFVPCEGFQETVIDLLAKKKQQDAGKNKAN